MSAQSIARVRAANLPRGSQPAAAGNLGHLRFLVLWILCCGPWVFLGCKAAGPRSVILITLDTVRADHLSGYGYAARTTRLLDQWSKRGTRFAFALSTSSSTAPSHASIFTGRYPSFHSIGAHNSQFALRPNAVTLAELLAEAGYQTAAIVSNPLLSRRLGLAQGFGHYDDKIRGPSAAIRAKARTARHAVDLAIERLDAAEDGPIFLWLHMQDPHGPYESNPSWECPLAPTSPNANAELPVGIDHSGYQSIPIYQITGDERRIDDYRRRYDCQIAFLDEQLGRLIETIERDSRFDDALLIVTADHGEAIGEDDFYFAHGHAVGLDQVHVPLIMTGPGVPADRVVQNPVSNLSIFATVLDFAGLPLPPQTDGRSLLGAPEDLAADVVFVESLNQVGVAHKNAFLRRDLRPVSATKFWAKGNPNNAGGTWKPLGKDVAQALKADEAIEAPTLRRMEVALEDFQARAHESRILHKRLRVSRSFSPDEIEALVSLGYAADPGSETGAAVEAPDSQPVPANR